VILSHKVLAFVSPHGSETDTDTEFFPRLIVNKFFYPLELNDKNMR
jgi:hypothetical protein